MEESNKQTYRTVLPNNPKVKTETDIARSETNRLIIFVGLMLYHFGLKTAVSNLFGDRGLVKNTLDTVYYSALHVVMTLEKILLSFSEKP